MQSFKQHSFQFLSRLRPQCVADDALKMSVMWWKSALKKKVKTSNSSDSITEKQIQGPNIFWLGYPGLLKIFYARSSQNLFHSCKTKLKVAS